MTIEERAHQYGCKAAGGWYKGGMRGSVYEAHHDAYIEIATEQREIDIDKACKWLEERCAFGVHPCSGYALVMEFKQAMEGIV